MKRAWIVIGIVIVALSVFGFYLKKAVDKITYDFAFKGFKILKLTLTGDSTVRIDIAVKILNMNPFYIRIDSLYYEVFYKGSLLAKSAPNTINSPINIPSNGVPYSFNESIEVHMNSTNIGVVQNYTNKVQSDFTLNVKVKPWGIPLPMFKNIKFSY
jgi:hypothetical protein